MDKKQYYIAVAKQFRNLKVFDMNGKKIKEFPKSEHYDYYFESYFDKKTSKNYCLYCGTEFLESYDCNKVKLFNKYTKSMENNNTYYHFVIYDNGIIVRLIAAFSKGIIKIFNFYSAELLSEIIIEKKFSSLCLWNNNYLFVANEKCSLKLMDLEKEKIIKIFPKEAENGVFVKMFLPPFYGECILSQHKDETIKLWVKNK